MRGDSFILMQKKVNNIYLLYIAICCHNGGVVTLPLKSSSNTSLKCFSLVVRVSFLLQVSHMILLFGINIKYF
jgi:hypothetical protein